MGVGPVSFFYVHKLREKTGSCQHFLLCVLLPFLQLVLFIQGHLCCGSILSLVDNVS